MPTCIETAINSYVIQEYIVIFNLFIQYCINSYPISSIGSPLVQKTNNKLDVLGVC